MWLEALNKTLNWCPDFLKGQSLAGKTKTKRLSLQRFCSDTNISDTNLDTCKNMAHTNISDIPI